MFNYFARSLLVIALLNSLNLQSRSKEIQDSFDHFEKSYSTMFSEQLDEVWQKDPNTCYSKCGNSQ